MPATDAIYVGSTFTASESDLKGGLPPPEGAASKTFPAQIWKPAGTRAFYGCKAVLADVQVVERQTLTFLLATLLVGVVPGCLDVPPPPATQADAEADTTGDVSEDARVEPDVQSDPDVADTPEPDVDEGDLPDDPDVRDSDVPDVPDVPDAPEDVEPDLCEPDCFGKVCGDDGCGGSCGECDQGQACVDDICQQLARPWEDILEERQGYGAETTGGKDADICLVTSAADAGAGTLRACAALPGGRWVRFALPGGTVLRPLTPIAVGSNTTIDGRGAEVVIGGRGFRVRAVENVILTDLRVENGDQVDENDGIQIQAADRVWVHHCTVQGWTDGAIDITRDVLNVTISRSYLADAGESGSLVGDPGDEYADHLMRITYHHNWFDGLRRGAPRAREATVHLVNNVFEEWSDAAIIVTHGAEVLVERNYFAPRSAGDVALEFELDQHPRGNTRTVENRWSANVVFRENGTVADPPYDFPTENAGPTMADRVRQRAGWRDIPFPGGD